MREKLTSLVAKAISDGLEYNQIVTAEGIADHLIASGVVALPVKVGQTVYVLSKCKCMKGKWAIECLARGKDSRMKYIDRVNVYNPKTSGRVVCYKMYARPFKVEYLKEIGKTVFLTKEEGQKALAERKEQ